MRAREIRRECCESLRESARVPARVARDSARFARESRESRRESRESRRDGRQEADGVRGVRSDAHPIRRARSSHACCLVPMLAPWHALGLSVAAVRDSLRDSARFGEILARIHARVGESRRDWREIARGCVEGALRCCGCGVAPVVQDDLGKSRLADRCVA